MKGKGKEDVLDNLPVDIQEALILEDLLYVLMVCLREWSLCSRCMAVFSVSAGTTYDLARVKRPITTFGLLFIPYFDLSPSFVLVHIITAMTRPLAFPLDLVISV